MIERTSDNLLTLPNSLKSQLERAERLLDQSEDADFVGNTSLAKAKAAEGFQVLAQLASTAPDLAFALMARQMGVREWDLEWCERVDRYQVIEKKFLGLSMGTEVKSVPTITTRSFRGRIR